MMIIDWLVFYANLGNISAISWLEQFVDDHVTDVVMCIHIWYCSWLIIAQRWVSSFSNGSRTSFTRLTHLFPHLIFFYSIIELVLVLCITERLLTQRWAIINQLQYQMCMIGRNEKCSVLYRLYSIYPLKRISVLRSSVLNIY
jgi:hypothetical protein